MMDLLLATSGGESQSASGGYVDDVFSAYTYTGNGATQTINNGIDLAGKGGLVWIKNRGAVDSHILTDSARGTAFFLRSELTNPQDTNTPNIISAFNSNGFGLGVSYSIVNASGNSYVSWTFRRSERFFDVVQYTGDGVAGRQIAHSLGVAPGMVIVKATNQTGDWHTYHRSLGKDYILNLNNTIAAFNSSLIWGTGHTSTHVDVRQYNTNGVQYVAYLFAHDLSAEGIIQCGSYVGNDSSNGPVVNLGWEPQWVMIKSASISNPWYISDEMRGFTAGVADGGFATLQPNASSAEVASTQTVAKTSTGFRIVNSGTGVNGSGATYIYLAIRRPNKPPTSGTQVYNAIARTGTGAAATVTGVGFAPDLVMCQARTPASITEGASTGSRLQGVKYLKTQSTKAEANNTPTGNSLSEWLMNGIFINGAASDFNDGSIPSTYINHFFRRAPGFMDVVCDTGTGVAHAIAHNLTKAPELIIRKSRSAATQWEVWHSALAATEKLVLNGNAAKVTDLTAWNSTVPTATQITVGTGASVNANTATFVTYLFSTLDGISKVGSYTGNGSTLNIDAGFGANGPAFILIKRTDSTGDWYLWDSARGIVSGNDPHLSLNTTAAEVTTDDSVDPTAGGFAVNQNTATNINVSSGTYIYLAIAGGVYVPSGEAVFTTPGTYNWTVPEGVTSVSVVCVGGGGGGGSGQSSSFGTTVAGGGKASGFGGSTLATGGAPSGTYTGGGIGGNAIGGPAGGGGAGGYSGNGGAGGTSSNASGSSGSGGAGGGGAYSSSGGGASGGGVGLYGQGNDGIGGSWSGGLGGGGSGGNNGANSSQYGAVNGGSYGGGGGGYGGTSSYGPGAGGGLAYANSLSVTPGSTITVVVGAGGWLGGVDSAGASGAVRIIWGYGRSFPYNAA